MTLTIIRNPGQLFWKLSRTYEFVFLLPHYKNLVYKFGKDMYTNIFYPPAFHAGSNFSSLFSHLGVFVSFFLFNLWFGMGCEGLPLTWRIVKHLRLQKIPL